MPQNQIPPFSPMHLIRIQGCTSLRRTVMIILAFFSSRPLAPFWELAKNDHQRAGAVLRNDKKCSPKSRRHFEKWHKIIKKEQAPFWEITKNDHQRAGAVLKKISFYSRKASAVLKKAAFFPQGQNHKERESISSLSYHIKVALDPLSTLHCA